MVKVMADPRLAEMMNPADIPFDARRIFRGRLRDTGGGLTWAIAN
jgi:uncharacterized protein YbaA (DUF1428 family)